MTPDGEAYFCAPLYYDDFSKSIPDMQRMFIHKMVYIWQ